MLKRSALAAAAALVTLIVLACVVTVAFAADIPVKAQPQNPFGNGYPTTKCGMYYGMGTGGSAGKTDGNVVGDRILQGEIDAIIGYTCPMGAKAFWFLEGSIGFNNVNGSVDGLALTGPLVAMQRFGFGSPINDLFGPGRILGNLSMPSLPSLPNGVTAGPANAYLFAGMVEQDVAAQVGQLPTDHVWLLAPLVGAGMLTRLSDGVVVDVWAGWQMNSQSWCPNHTLLCGKLGNAGRVGTSFKF